MNQADSPFTMGMLVILMVIVMTITTAIKVIILSNWNLQILLESPRNRYLLEILKKQAQKRNCRPQMKRKKNLKERECLDSKHSVHSKMDFSFLNNC
jgi:predicted Holliday junction resolvase-like endonuclease